MKAAPSSDHYSYRHYADPATAQTFDDRRFGGPIGDLVAATQADALLRFLEPVRGRRVLDVGTGTGRAASMFAQRGAVVTGVDASDAMLAVARRRAAGEGLTVDFRAGDAHALAFGDRSFDAAICLRVLMHTPEWRQVIGELCRVSDRQVVLDFPSASGFAILESAGRRVAYRVGRATEPYRVFTLGTIRSELSRRGYRIADVHRQFVLPIAVHKAIGSRAFTERAERLLASAGLLRVFGSPVTILAERCASS